MGEDVYSVGFYVAGGKTDVGYFKGNIVNFTQFEEAPGLTGLSLSYAVIEGLSGSPCAYLPQWAEGRGALLR